MKKTDELHARPALIPWVIALLLCVGWSALGLGHAESADPGPNEVGISQASPDVGVQGHLPLRPVLVRDIPSVGFARVELPCIWLPVEERTELPPFHLLRRNLKSREPPLA
ncbi:hypothetical protein HNR46_000626 [Haloferula luteola]|uniref:Uncharacterized protein n=1 Tax=Haloferula luteola TaxID=595692 RepID=A0A840UX97_9BACT|nr:hypothetical protein [Haloferula luteola]MBB5350402.1 hypothetical protein [Haloferula luteola]